MKNFEGQQHTVYVDAYGEKLDSSIETVNFPRAGEVDDSVNYQAAPQILLDYADTLYFDKRTKSTALNAHNSSSIQRSQLRGGAKHSV